MKKYSFYLIALALILALAVFVACDNANDPADTEGVTDTEAIAEETEPAPAELKFSEGGVCGVDDLISTAVIKGKINAVRIVF